MFTYEINFKFCKRLFKCNFSFPINLFVLFVIKAADTLVSTLKTEKAKLEREVELVKKNLFSGQDEQKRLQKRIDELSREHQKAVEEIRSSLDKVCSYN